MPETLTFDAEAMIRQIYRQQLAWSLARNVAGRIMDTIDGRSQAVVQRFTPHEQELVAADWPVCRQVLVACLPDVIEVVLDVLAEGFNHKILDQIAKRCVRPQADTPLSSSSPASPAPG